MVDINENSSWEEIQSFINGKMMLSSPGSKGRAFAWFCLVNLGILITMFFILNGDIAYIALFILGSNIIAPFCGLLFSKWMAKRSHRMRILSKNSDDPYEAHLCRTVECLALKAGLDTVPEVWLYDSPDINAFATGPSKNNAMIAFSTALMAQMAPREITAVAAHEIAHIANGDMFIMTVATAIVRLIATLLCLPLQIFTIFCFDDSFIGVIVGLIMVLVTFLISKIIFFLGDLVLKAFSRKREFAADAFASELLDGNSICDMLKKLKNDDVPMPRKQQAYSMLKIKGSNLADSAIFDIFSTHPSINRRIVAIEQKIADSSDLTPLAHDQATSVGLQDDKLTHCTYIMCMDGVNAGIEIPLSCDPVTIGRDPMCAALIYDSPDVSRKHACVSITNNGEVLVEDLGSTNGTFYISDSMVNRVEGKLFVRENTIFNMGNTNNRFEIRFR